MSTMSTKGISLAFQHSYGAFRLEVAMELPGQGVSVLFGPSGCGKTTLLRLIAGLERCTQGQLHVRGDIWQQGSFFVPPHKRNLGYVFQNANLFPHLSVRQNLEYGVQRIPAPRRLPSLEPLINLLGIAALLERKPARLSGGEQQRVAIARALAVNPEVLLMDEPLAALDYARKQELLPYLQRLQQELTIPILYVTHSPDEVAQLANHLAILNAGHCVASGPVQQVLTSTDLPIRLGEDAGAVFDAVVQEHDQNDHLLRLGIGLQSVWVREHPFTLGARVRARILARDVSLALELSPQSSILNHLQATVTHIVNDSHPAQALVHLDVDGNPLLARVTHRSLSALRITIGQRVWAQVKTMAVLG